MLQGRREREEKTTRHSILPPQTRTEMQSCVSSLDILARGSLLFGRTVTEVINLSSLSLEKQKQFFAVSIPFRPDSFSFTVLLFSIKIQMNYFNRRCGSILSFHNLSPLPGI